MAMINFFNAAVCAEIVAFLTALLLVSKRNSFWWLFIVYLAVVIAIEAGGFYLKELQKPNYLLYNFLMIVQAVFFGYIFYQFLDTAKTKKIVLVLFAVFLLFFIVEAINNSFAQYNTYSRQGLSLIVVVVSCMFYFSVLKNDSISSPLIYPPFWIVTGLFFYYFGTAAMFAFYKSVYQIKLAGNISFYSLVMGCLSCILYGSWIIAFVCQKKQVSL
jgi:hypothetical protein